MHVQMMAESQIMADVLQSWNNPGTAVNLCGNSSVIKRELGLNGVGIAAVMHTNDSSISHKWLNSVVFTYISMNHNKKQKKKHTIFVQLFVILEIGGAV